MTALARLWRTHRIALLAFVAALAVTLFFAARLVFFTVYWTDPAHRDRHPEGWMTPGYLAKSWHVPREALGEALSLPPAEGRPPTLAEIAAERGQPVAAFLTEVEAILARLKDEEPAR